MSAGCRTCAACCLMCCGICLIPFIWIVTSLFVIFNIAEIAIGAVYKDDCPREPMIPIYLIVAGVLGILYAIVNSNESHEQKKKKKTKYDEEAAEKVMMNDDTKDAAEADEKPAKKKSNCLAVLAPLVTLICIIWFIVGHVYVFRIHKDFDDTNEFIQANITDGGLDNSTEILNPDFCHHTLYYFAFWSIILRYIILGAIIIAMCCIGCGGLAICASASKMICGSDDDDDDGDSEEKKKPNDAEYEPAKTEEEKLNGDANDNTNE